MPVKRLSGSKNYFYHGALGTEVEGDGVTPLPTEGFYKITAIAATGSAFPATAVVGDIFYNKPAITAHNLSLFREVLQIPASAFWTLVHHESLI